MARVLTYADPGSAVSRCGGVVAVLPVGSTEYHPGNLPLSIDSIIANLLARRLAGNTATRDSGNERCIYILPPLNYGFSHEWIRYPGTASLRPQTLIDVVTEIIISLGINAPLCGAIIINAHGGNTGVLEAAARILHYSHGLDVSIIDIWRTASRLGQGFCHGCRLEARVAEMLGATTQSEAEDAPGSISCSDGIYYCKDEMVTGITAISHKQLLDSIEKEFNATLRGMLEKCARDMERG